MKLFLVFLIIFEFNSKTSYSADCIKEGEMPADLINFIGSNNFKVNTSNENKLKEFKKYLGGNILSETTDLKEPNSDAITVIQYKASQFEDVLVDDTSLDIEGENVGVNVKNMLDQLFQFVGKKAVFRCLIGIRHNDQVFIFKSEIEGEIVEPRGKSFGFLPYFKPIGAIKTLAEELPDKYNARFHAINNFKNNKPHLVCTTLPIWLGTFQSDLVEKGTCNDKKISNDFGIKYPDFFKFKK